MFYVLQRVLRPAFFLIVKIAPCSFSEMKNKPCPFPTIRRARFLPKIVKCYLKSMRLRKISALKNSRFCTKKRFCFYMEKHLIKEVIFFFLSAFFDSCTLGLRMIFFRGKCENLKLFPKIYKISVT